MSLIGKLNSTQMNSVEKIELTCEQVDKLNVNLRKLTKKLDGWKFQLDRAQGWIERLELDETLLPQMREYHFAQKQLRKEKFYAYFTEPAEGFYWRWNGNAKVYYSYAVGKAIPLDLNFISKEKLEEIQPSPYLLVKSKIDFERKIQGLQKEIKDIRVQLGNHEQSIPSPGQIKRKQEQVDIKRINETALLFLNDLPKRKARSHPYTKPSQITEVVPVSASQCCEGCAVCQILGSCQ